MRRLLSSSAIAVVVMAMPVSGALAQSDGRDNRESRAAEQPCERLVTLAREHEETFQRVWIDHANEIARQGNDEACSVQVSRAEDALEQQEGNSQAAQGQQQEDGRIVVTQPEPRVTVEQDAPEVTVAQPQPNVNVQQAEPQIIVRQAQPTVRLQMPQPTVTIDQPQPEIIVRMPEPEVSVGMPEPEVEVSQNQPEVNVQQSEPEVQVELQRPQVNVQEQDNAQVQVERGQPVVRQEAQGEAQVAVEQAQPQVSYEAAEPKLEVEQAGEPKVEFSQSGEPNIRVERLEEQAASNPQDRSAGQQASALDQERQGQEQEYTTLSERQNAGSGAEAASTAQVDPQQTASTEPGSRLLGAPGEQAVEGEITSISVSEIIGSDLVNGRGEELGTIEQIVRTDEGEYAIVAHGGLLGFGEDQVALPLDHISVSADTGEFIMSGMSQEEIDQLPQFDMEGNEPLSRDSQVDITSRQQG